MLRVIVCLMVFNALFNYISDISWRSVLLVEETGEPRENHRTVAGHWQIESHNVVHLSLIEIRTHNISGDMHVQAVPITTKVASSNPAHGEVYSIKLYVITFVSDQQQACGLLRVLRFPAPIRFTTTI